MQHSVPLFHLKRLWILRRAACLAPLLSAMIAMIAASVGVLLPTRHVGEGIPGVVVEALFAGRPIITTRWKEMEEIVVEGRNGLFVPAADAQALRDAMRRLVSSYGSWREICRSTREMCEPYSEERVMGEILVPQVLALGQSHGH